MHRSLLLLAALPTIAAAQSPLHPRDIVRHALAAVEGDSAEVVRVRWARAAAARPHDRLAMLGVATIARLTYVHDAAAILYDSLAANAGQPDLIAGYALLGRSQGARLRGVMTDAERFAARAVRAGEALRDSTLMAESMIALASARLRTAGPASADSLFARARTLRLDERLTGMWHCGRAEMLALSFRSAAAEARAGAERAQAAGDRRQYAACMHLVAADSARRGFVSEAVDLFGKVAEERRRLHDRSGLASTLQWSGAQNRVQGHLEPAYRQFQEAIAEGRASGNGSAVAWSFAGLQAIEAQLGDARAAAEYGDSAAAMFSRQGDRYGHVLALELRAVQSFLLGDLTRARDEYRRAAVVYDTLRFGQGAVTSRMGLINVAFSMNDIDGAERATRELEATAKRHGMTAFVKSARYFFALAALRRGDYQTAERLFGSQLEEVSREARMYPNGAQPQWEYYDGMRLAELYARRGDLGRAARFATEASEAIDRWRATLSRRELRLRGQQMTETLNDPDMGLSTVVARLVDAGRVDTAFALVERLHARELLDHMARADGLRNADAAQGDSSRRARVLTQLLTTSELAASLPDSTALVEYLIGSLDARSTVFVLGRNGVRASTFAPSDSLGAAVARFTTLLEGGATPRELARSLGQAVLDPVVALLPPGTTRLMVVPDGPLHRLPFDALLLEDDRFAVERFSIATVPSGSIAARLRRQPSPASAVRVLALGDPELARVTQQGGRSAATAALAGARADVSALHDLPRLRAGGREARSVARYGNGSLALTGAAASESRLKRLALGEYRVLHFATHARVDESTLSGTALALAPGDGEDGLLGPGELSSFALAADLVTLSACRSGGGTVVRGEGIVGLAAPLIGAGARSIALTRWPIGDEATPRFIQEFYEAIARGSSAGDALRDAKLSAMRRGAPPAEWAAFTIVGDPFVTIPLGEPRRGWLLPIMLGVAVILFVLAVARRRTRPATGSP